MFFVNLNMQTRILFFVIVFTFISCKKENEVTEVKYWYDNIGSRTDIPFLPDGSANYFTFSFIRNSGDKIGYRFKAKFMHARYQSYNVYDINTRSSLSSISDKEILPNIGSINPFVALTQPGNREYTVYVLPNIPEAQSYENKLLFSDSVTNVSLILRNYLAEIDVYGGVPLPEIEAFNLLSGEAVSLPVPLRLDFTVFTKIINVDDISKIISLTQLLQSGNNITCFRFAGLGLFPNLDNQYLLAPIKLQANEVAILKFIPPTYPTVFSEIPTSDVRYYSLCLGDSKTYNYKTLYDKQLKISSDGFIYVVVGRNQADIVAKAAGLNYMEWVPELKNEGLVVYRNMLTSPGYPYNLNLVPDVLKNLNQVLNPGYLDADTYLGDHSPKGIKMSKEAYLENFGGFEVVY